jgi:hypothetical protein
MGFCAYEAFGVCVVRPLSLVSLACNFVGKTSVSFSKSFWAMKGEV